jgi:hypothetical protein
MNDYVEGEKKFSRTPSGRKTLILFIWLLAVIIEGASAVVLLFTEGTGSSNAWILGLSKVSFMILGGILVLLSGFIAITFLLVKNRRTGSRITDWAFRVIHNPFVYYLLIGISALGIVVFSQIYHFASTVSDPYVQGYLVRLKPLFCWLFLMSSHTFILLPLFRYQLPNVKGIRSNAIVHRSGITLIVFMVLWIVIGVTGIGITPDKAGWDAPGVPLIPIQLTLVWLVVIVFLIIELWLGKYFETFHRKKIIDVVVCTILWLIAFTLWNLVPLTPDYFAPEPRAPNFEYYPYSDAALHDLTAQKLLIGEGFEGIPRKPLYALFLVFSHWIAGQAYMDVIRIQLALLAFLPVLIYLLTKGLHHRVSGLAAAILLILRERNSIGLSGDIGVSHSKLLMSDLPATAGLVFITLLIIWWLKDSSRKYYFPLGIGGGIGLILLLRPQFTVIIPVVILLVILKFIKHPSQAAKSIGLLSVGFALTLTPWFYRSYHQTGRIALNDPNQMAFLTQQYRLQPGTGEIRIESGESTADYIQKINTYLKEFIIQHPLEVTGFISAHFLHNEVEMVQAVPLSFWYIQNPDSELFPYWRTQWEKLWGDCCSVQPYVDAIGFWDQQPASISTNQFLPLFLNLTLISIGLAATWSRFGLVGLVPLALSLAYSFSTAIGRYSGWRLILPADWVVFLYLSIGIGQVAIWLITFITHTNVNFSKSDDGRLLDRGFRPPVKFPFPGIILCTFLFGLGLLPILVETIIPQRYVPISERELLRSQELFTDEEIDHFLESDQSVVVEGRALYPRYYRSGIGEPGEGWTAFSERYYDRLGFILAGPETGSIILPLEDSPETFPNAVDVVVIGCQEEEFIDAAAVILFDEHENRIETLFRSPLESLTCPLTPP